MRRFDCFPFNNELDLLECRLVELEDVVDTFVLVEATVTHGRNEPKPLHYQNNQDRFERWRDRIVHVVADVLPDDPDAWSREWAQREYLRRGLESVGVEPDDIVFQSDCDEIPRADVAKNLTPQGMVACIQDLYCFAVDWLHPLPWVGTIAAPYRLIESFAVMRSARLNKNQPVIPDAGWHLSWLGGYDANVVKLNSFCHPEIEPETRPRLNDYYEQGVHVDGAKLIEADGTDLPRWIMDRKCPDNWWRPEHPKPVTVVPPKQRIMTPQPT
jgi:hypothetical protein